MIHIKYIILFVGIVTFCFSLNAQHDLSLQFTNDAVITETEEVAVFTLKINNLNNTDVTNLSVRIQETNALDFMGAITSENTSFSEVSGIWTINNQLASSVSDLELVLMYAVTEQGTHFLQAEVETMDGVDLNSVPQNGNFYEDDFSITCVSVPIIIEIGDTIQLGAPALPSEYGHIWQKTDAVGTSIVSEEAIFNATLPGVYSYSNDLSECDLRSCCGIILIAAIDETLDCTTDTEAPIITPIHPLLAGISSGDEITIECDEPFSLASTDVIVTDNFDTDVTVTVEEEEIIIGNCIDDGFLVWMNCYYEATDDCGNVSQFFVRIKIVDTVAPTLTGIPNDITVSCSSDVPTIIEPIAYDNCTNSQDLTVTYQYDDDTNDNSCDYYVIRRWHVTDDCGNLGTATQIITVLDDETPFIIDTLEAVTVSCSSDLPILTEPEFFDNCTSSEDLTVVYTEEEQGEGCNLFIIHTWSVTDICGNTASFSQTITVTDEVAPVIVNVPENSSVDLSAGEVIPNISTNITASDNCVPNIPIIFDETTVGDNCDYQIIRSWTATDNCGNVTTEIQIITVTDNLNNITYSVTSDTCQTATGTIIFTPNTYTYAWSNGFSGSSQAGLSAGAYEITASNAAGCFSDFQIEVGETCGCPDFTIEQENYENATCNANNGSAIIIPSGEITDYTYTWIPDLGIANSTNNSRTDLPPSDYLVIVLFEGNTECEEKVEFTIENDETDCLEEIPISSPNTQTINNIIFVGQEDEFCLDTEELTGEIISVENICAVSESFAIVEQTENMLCLSSIGMAAGTEEICLVVCDEYNICDTTYLNIIVLERDDENPPENIFIYSGFSPNGDNINETFTITGLENFPVHHLTIFNRWGLRVFKSNNYQNDWSGTYNNTNLPAGTYFYLLELGNTERKSGYVQIN